MAAATEKIRSKVHTVREAIGSNNFNNDQICLVLQYYDNAVDKAIAAFLEDGAIEALGQWQTMGGTNKIVAPKKKKKKNKSKSKDNVTENGIDATDKGRDLCSEAGSDPVSEVPDVASGLSTPLSEIPPPSSFGCDGVHAGVTSSSADAVESSAVARPSHAASSNGDIVKRTSADVHVGRPGGANSYQQQNKKGREAVSSTAQQPDSTHGKAHMSLDKSFKDLHRQTVALERLKIVLGENVDRSFKRVNEVFKELHKELSEREALLLAELTKAKVQSHDVLLEQEQRAKALRLQSERSAAMNDNDLTHLRADIKQFVGDRKIYEDMSSAPLFTCSINQIVEDIRTFGQVNPVKISPSAVQSPIVTSTVNGNASRQLQTSSTSSSSSKAEGLQTPADKPTVSGLHVLTQSDSLTRYEENERKQRSADNRSQPVVQPPIQPPVERGERGSRGRGGAQRGRGAGSGRGGRDGGHGGRHGQQHDGSGRGYSGRTFYNSQGGANVSPKGRGPVSDSADHQTSGSRGPVKSEKSGSDEAANDQPSGNGGTLCNGTTGNRISDSANNSRSPPLLNGHRSSSINVADKESSVTKATHASPKSNQNGVLPQRTNRRSAGERRRDLSSSSAPVADEFVSSAEATSKEPSALTCNG